MSTSKYMKIASLRLFQRQLAVFRKRTTSTNLIQVIDYFMEQVEEEINFVTENSERKVA